MSQLAAFCDYVTQRDTRFTLQSGKPEAADRDRLLYYKNPYGVLKFKSLGR